MRASDLGVQGFRGGLGGLGFRGCTKGSWMLRRGGSTWMKVLP